MLARAAQKQFALDKVLFVPALIPPHKKTSRTMTPAPYRYRMVEMAIESEPAFEVSDVEFNRPEISYTVDTLRDLRKKYPGDKLYLILGEDSVSEMPSWREPEEITKMADFLVARRPGYLLKAPFGNLEWIDMPLCPVSSSDIRVRISRGEAPAAGSLNPKVESYIKKMSLYANPAGT